MKTKEQAVYLKAMSEREPYFTQKNSPKNTIQLLQEYVRWNRGLPIWTPSQKICRWILTKIQATIEDPAQNQKKMNVNT